MREAGTGSVHDERRSEDAPGRRVLITSSYYFPEAAGNAPYVTGLAEHLARRGHDVTVVTGFPHYPEWRSSAGGRLGAREFHEGVEVRRRWHYVPGHQSAVTRAAYEASLCVLGATGLPRRPPDVILGISPTLAAAALANAASRLYERPYGLIYQDLQGRAAAQSGVAGGARIARFVERGEIGVARRAAAIGVITEGFRPYFVEHGVDGSRIHRLRNWSQDTAPSETAAAARARLGWGDDDFVCLHAGNMGHKQALENVLRAAALVDDGQVRIVLAGDGNERARLARTASDLGLGNASFVPPQPPGQFEAMLAAADVLIVNQRASVGDMSLASKLTSYFTAARPVIAAVAETSETGQEVQRAAAGLLVPPEEPAALAEAIRWIRGHPQEAGRLGASGARYAGAELAPATILASYETFLDRIYDQGTERSRRRLRQPVGSTADVPAQPPLLGEPGGTTPLLSCLIVSYNACADLERCIVSLEGEAPSVDLEVIVVDNASDDGTVSMVERRFPWVRLVANAENVGFARAANSAMQVARGRYLLHLNPDTIVPPGAVQAFIGEIERRPEVGMLGCKLVQPDGTFDHACKRGAPTIASAIYYLLGLSTLFRQSPRFAHYTAGHLDRDETGFVDAINGAFMLVRRDAAAEVGGLDERYWLYGEDLDWCVRFSQRGWKILYWPEIEVTHVKGASTGRHRSWRPNVAFHQSMWLYYDKHLARRHPPLVGMFVRIGIWSNFARTVTTSSIRSMLEALRPDTRMIGPAGGQS